MLNGLQLTPEEILLEMGQTFVSGGNFTALAPYVRGGNLLRIMYRRRPAQR
ncbi:MAG: hypothetical protein ACLR2G_03240 [Phascolarctobacterium faecium]